GPGLPDLDEESGQLVAVDSEVERGERRLELCRTPWSDEDRRHARVGEQPGERECRRVAELLEALEPVVNLVLAKMFVRLGAHRHPRSRRRGFAAPVLAREPAAGERAERREAETVLLAERQDLLLRVAVEERVRVLHPAERAGAKRLPQLVTVDVARPVEADLAVGNELVQCTGRFG